MVVGMSELSTLPLVAGFGALAGLRTLAAPLAIARASRVKNLDLSGTPLALIGSSKAAHTLAAFALGELVADKLPFTPNRTDFVGLAARFASGALAGASIAKARKSSWVSGALIGGSVAVGAAFAAFQLRKSFGDATHIPDKFVAFAEDGLVAGLGMLLVKALEA